MEMLVNKLAKDFPWIIFVKGDVAHWSSSSKTVIYEASGNNRSSWSLLHEVGHAIACHESYSTDVSLLQKETEAWAKAIEIAPKYNITIDDNHVQDCLDTYRDWLHKRSTCPHCDGHGLQQSKTLYRCFNCQSTWKVSSARFCRPYRLKKALAA
jgi:hypothetical protein